ncbi:Probable pectate lyase 7 [Linum grandiflorum]
MASLYIKFSLVVLVSVSTLVHDIGAHIVDFDEYWQQRAEEARRAALETYHPEPYNVTEHFTAMVHMDLFGTNSTRRRMMKDRGRCMATNPIDRCWRCDRNWAKNRQKLADCVQGFGYRTRGGKGGPIYVVTDASDCDMINPKPGTLRHAVIQKGPLWIIFGRSMIIKLTQELLVTCDKTIDARGANVHIANGAGITLQYVNNVIIHGLHIHDIVPGTGGLIRDSVDHYGHRGMSDGDGISLYGASNIWIDHVSMSNCGDGIIDAIMGSTGVTISNSHFTDHNEVLLFGASASHSNDTIMQITIAFTHFGKGLVQRMPRCRWGFFHVVNNDYTHWLMYAIGGSNKPTIISQGNRFIAPENHNAKQVTKREYADEGDWKSWDWVTEGDLLMNGAYFIPSGNPRVASKFTSRQLIKQKPGTFVTRLTRYAGTLECCVGKPC